MADEELYKKLETELGKRPLQDIEIPDYIIFNLRHTFFDWQSSAFKYFLAYNNPKNGFFQSPTHLMFNLATGSGKTLLMAAAILYYYRQGYRHFLFFVNRNNIVDKTENNFIDNTHAKYLFKEKIIIDDKTIMIKKVNTFSDDPQGIEIKFTSIQKLYNDIHIEKENQTTLEDLHRKKIVMLADEAHHLNTDTKKGAVPQELIPTEITNKTGKEEVERKGWEHTVLELILNQNGKKADNKNVLLEFTATIPDQKAVVEKYAGKTIYKFTLKEFLQAGYTKEINLISSTSNKKERVLLALFLQWYRHRIALDYGISNFKPVILFRSKTIEASKADHKEFLRWMDDISSDDFTFLQDIEDKLRKAKQPTLLEMEKSRVETLLEYINNQKIHLGEVAEWIKESYQERNVIITNSQTNKTQTEKTDEDTERLLNSLENKNNHIRAIFTVDRLTEGWDVLNLFDIVRLYEGQNAGGSTKRTPEATIKEKQLIGRGVRYYPFHYQDTLKNKRKFDEDVTHELRVLEELYYYTYDEESRYISHLKNELRKDGYIQDDRVSKTFSLKEDFKNSDFYKKTKIWYNEQIDNPNRKKKTLNDIKKDFSFTYGIKSLKLIEQEIDLANQEEDLQRLELQEGTLQTISITFKDIEKHIVQKAIHSKAKQEHSLFQFENLKEELAITSMEDLQTQKNMLADFPIAITVEKQIGYDDIENSDKLALTIKFLDKVSMELKRTIHPKKGSEFRLGNFRQFFDQPKTKIIDKNMDNSEANSLAENQWYVVDSFAGTAEEKGLIKFIKKTMGDLEERYREIYLLRNEEVYKIYDFEQGRGFQPDFILFLRNQSDSELYYQIFIEPKGEQSRGLDGGFSQGKEGWKEEFLQEITKRYGLKNIIRAENPDYRLLGLRFYNQKDEKHFSDEFTELILPTGS